MIVFFLIIILHFSENIWLHFLWIEYKNSSLVFYLMFYLICDHLNWSMHKHASSGFFSSRGRIVDQSCNYLFSTHCRFLQKLSVFREKKKVPFGVKVTGRKLSDVALQHQEKLELKKWCKHKQRSIRCVFHFLLFWGHMGDRDHWSPWWWRSVRCGVCSLGPSGLNLERSSSCKWFLTPCCSSWSSWEHSRLSLRAPRSFL